MKHILKQKHPLKYRDPSGLVTFDLLNNFPNNGITNSNGNGTVVCFACLSVTFIFFNRDIVIIHVFFNVSMKI